MARPNVLTYKGSGILQIINDSEFEAIAEVVLEKFASVDGPGNIYNAQGANTAYVAIGDFTDTRYQGAIGTGDVTLLSTTYTLYQDRTSNYGSVTNPPLHWNGTDIKIANNTELNDLADAIIQYMVIGDGPGGYVLTSAAPAGGTWVSIGSINNVQDTANTTVTTLFKKISGTTTLTHSPLKHVSGGTIQIMTQAEIEQLVEKVRERIITTQIGYYAFQLAAPTPGTWAEMGTILDTRPTISAQDYVGPIYTSDVNYTGIIPISYLGGSDVPYDTDYIGTYDTDYVSSVIVGYDGVAPAAYTTTFEGPSGINYLGPGFATYDGDYLGGIVYDGVAPTNYVGDYIGPISYVGVTPATYVADYVGPATYVGITPITYVTGFIGPVTYVGPAEVTYDSTRFVTVNYLGPLADSINYAGTTPASYLGPSAPVTYIGPLDGVLYVSTDTDGAPYASQSGVPNVNYLGPGPANFTNYTLFPLYLGPSAEPFYLGDITTVNYLGPGGPAANYTSLVANVTNYLGPGTANAINYVGPGAANSINYLGPGPGITYVRTKTLSYVGPGPANATNYLGPGAATSYLGPGADTNYLGPGNQDYQGSQKLNFVDYTSIPSINYVGPATPDAINYESDNAINYLGSGAPVNYLGAGPDVSYLGPLDGPTYIGPGTTPDGAGYIGIPEVLYTALIAADYLGTNPDGAVYDTVIAYLGNYAGLTPDAGSYILSVTYESEYAGVTPASYVGVLTYDIDYLGVTAANYDNTVAYLGDYVGIGPVSYISETTYLGQFVGFAPVFYVGTLSYITDYIGVTGGVFSSPLPSSYTSSYDGPAYTTTYIAAVPDTVNYDSTVPNDYAGAVDYQSTYAGSIINNNSSVISTKTLWRRIL
jgi:hypothetical protein